MHLLLQHILKKNIMLFGIAIDMYGAKYIKIYKSGATSAVVLHYNTHWVINDWT